MADIKSSRANIYLLIPSLVAMLSIWPVSTIEYFTYPSDFREQVSLINWLFGSTAFFYVHNFLNIVVPSLMLVLCLIFLKKYNLSLIFISIYYLTTLVSLANYLSSNKFFDSSFTILNKLKFYFGFYDATNVIFNIVHFLQSIASLILPLLALLITKKVTQIDSSQANFGTESE